MKLTNKVFLLILASSLVYLKFFKVNLLVYLLLESITVGSYLSILTVYEALSIKDCTEEFQEYQRRQKKVLNKN